jgi:hypothetical protein
MTGLVPAATYIPPGIFGSVRDVGIAVAPPSGFTFRTGLVQGFVSFGPITWRVFGGTTEALKRGVLLAVSVNLISSG